MIVKDLQADYNALKDDIKHSYDVSIPSALSMYPSLSDADYRVLTVLMSFFNQYEETFASNKLLAESTNRSERSITRIIGNLKRQGYITVEFEYRNKEIIKRWIKPTEKLNEIKQKSKLARGIDKTCIKSIAKSGVENINIINKNKEYIGEFKNVGLTEEEKEKLTNRFGKQIFDRSVAKLSSYLDTNQKKARQYKSHYSVILSWVVKSVLEANPPKTLTMGQMKECSQIFPIESKYIFQQGTNTFNLR